MKANQTPKIRLRSVQKSFGSNHVLRGINLDIMPGESCVIIGASGSGKSVLIKSILGLLDVDDGHILIDGMPKSQPNHPEHEAFLHQCGVLFQGAALFDSMNVRDNITFALRQRGMSPAAAAQSAPSHLKKVGLKASVADLYPDALSGGMKKRVGLARAIATSPSILFFDEPTTGLDPIMGGLINRLIRDCVHTLGATAITITHDMESARQIAHKIGMIHQGKIIWHGTVAQMNKAKNTHLRQFLDTKTQ